MKTAIYVLIIAVITAMFKGLYDIKIALDNGESAQSVFSGATPMLLLGLFAIHMLGKILGDLSKPDETAQDN